MNIKPAFDVLIVEEIKADEKTAAGLFVPGTVVDKDSLCKAKILKAGPGMVSRDGKTIPHEYVEGDVVVFDKMRGYPVTHGGKPYLFVNAHQVFGKVVENPLVN